MMQDKLEQVIKPLLDDLGLVLWGVEYLSQGKHSLLRIYIDKPGGVNINDCELAGKEISALLNVEDLIKQNYSLEVSSPGIPRPFFHRSQYENYIGKELLIKLQSSLQGKRKLQGTLLSVNSDDLLLKINDQQLIVPFSQIMKANLIDE